MVDQHPRTSSGDGPRTPYTGNGSAAQERILRNNQPGPREATGREHLEGTTNYAGVESRSSQGAEYGHSRYSQESIPGQIRGLTHDVTTLFSQEMALARSELREAVAGVKAGIGSITIGAGLASSGLLILLLSAVYGLGTVIALWLSALIVGAVALIIGIVAMKAGQKKIEPSAFRPNRTIESMHKDKEVAEERIK